MNPTFSAAVLRRCAPLLLVLAGVGCQKEGKNGPKAAPPPPAAAPAAQASPSQSPEAVLANLPGMDFSALSATARKELAQVLTDEFCHCGCPHALGDCLRTHPGCRHAKRMTALAATQAAAGAPGLEIINSLGKHYLSFRDPRVQLKVDPAMCKGPADAPVTLVEFSDFECPYCAAAIPVLNGLLKSHPTNLRLCFLPFPLTEAHPNALPAAQVALLARDRGKFWPMHDLLFENQKALGRESLVALAGKVGLSAAEVTKVLDGGKYRDEAMSHRQQGQTAKVDSTPTLLFNGRKSTLPLSEATLSHAVEDELEWKANQGSWQAD